MNSVLAPPRRATNVKPKKEKKVPVKVTEDQHQEVVELLKGKCLEVSFTIHSLPKSKRIKGKQADTIASSLGGRRKGIRSSWALFTSNHPAVKELNAAIRAVEVLRDTWTIVQSAATQKGAADSTAIESGRRLLWAADVEEFYKLFKSKARAVDSAAKRVAHAMDHEELAEDGVSQVQSIKDMDKHNAGEAWESTAYPTDVEAIVGVAKEQDAKGAVRLDPDGEPIYIVNFSEYHVSEKLPELLRKRAIERLDAKLSETVETSFSYIVNEFNSELKTFLDELSSRTRILPVKGHAFNEYCKIEAAEVVKAVNHEMDNTVPAGCIKLFISYKTKAPPAGVVEDMNDDAAVVVRRWLDPITQEEYEQQVRPQATDEKRKIFPSVIESIIAKIQNFRDKKSKMLGAYGDNAMVAFETLFAQFNKLRTLGDNNERVSRKIADKLRSDDGFKDEMVNEIADTMSALDDQTEEVRRVRRKVSSKYFGIGK